MTEAMDKIQAVADQEYKYGFVTEIETDSVARGLNEETVREISARKNEPPFMLEWRLRSFGLFVCDWLKHSSHFGQLEE